MSFPLTSLSHPATDRDHPSRCAKIQMSCEAEL